MLDPRFALILRVRQPVRRGRIRRHPLRANRPRHAVNVALERLRPQRIAAHPGVAAVERLVHAVHLDPRIHALRIEWIDHHHGRARNPNRAFLRNLRLQIIPALAAVPRAPHPRPAAGKDRAAVGRINRQRPGLPVAHVRVDDLPARAVVGRFQQRVVGAGQQPLRVVGEARQRAHRLLAHTASLLPDGAPVGRPPDSLPNRPDVNGDVRHRRISCVFAARLCAG